MIYESDDPIYPYEVRIVDVFRTGIYVNIDEWCDKNWPYHSGLEWQKINNGWVFKHKENAVLLELTWG